MKLIKIFKNIWVVIRNVIILIILLIIFSNAGSKFERIVLSLLTLIFLSMIAFVMTYSRYKAFESKLEWERFKRLRKLLKYEPNDIEKEIDNETEKELIEKVIIKFNYAIEGIFIFIFFLISLFNLLSATLLNSY